MNLHLRIACLFLILLAGCSQKDRPFFEDKEILVSSERVAAYAIPNIITTAAGTVLCFVTARVGDNHDWGNVMEAVVIRSTDNGETWENPKVIAAIPDWTVQETSALYVKETNKILVFGHKCPRFNANGERINETWMIGHPEESKALGASYFVVESMDDGITWSEMKKIDLPYWPHDPGIVVRYGEHKGRLILPSRTTIGKAFDWNNMFNGVLISDDNGLTWRAGGLTQSHVGEACVVELSDGRIYVSSRNHADNYGIRVHAISSDGGETFSDFGDDPQLIEPTCDAGMITCSGLCDENIILFSNPAMKATKNWDSASRKLMSVRVSFDDCKSWPVQKLVFQGPAAYSGLAVNQNGMVFLAYERASEGSNDSRENIAVARFNLAWLKEAEVDPPEIWPSSGAFYDRQEVRIRAPENTVIRFTLDGTDPDIASQRYENSFIISESTTILAATFSTDGRKSITTPAVFQRSPYPAPHYKFPVDHRYPASGDFALLDGKRGTLNFNDGRWQGIEEADFDITIDMVNPRSISSISCGFLQATDFWIFYPDKVMFAVSEDGKNYQSVTEITGEMTPVRRDLSKRDYTTSMNPATVRFIQIHAENIKTCPEWHICAGGKAWLFADEIEIH